MSGTFMHLVCFESFIHSQRHTTLKKKPIEVIVALLLHKAFLSFREIRSETWMIGGTLMHRVNMTVSFIHQYQFAGGIPRGDHSSQGASEDRRMRWIEQDPRPARGTLKPRPSWLRPLYSTPKYDTSSNQHYFAVVHRDIIKRRDRVRWIFPSPSCSVFVV